jgi:hypothetical protein
LWTKAGAVGNGANRCPRQACWCGASRIVHKSTVLRRPWVARPAVVLRVHAQSVSPQSPELVPEQLGVHALAFVAKPEQLPERTSHLARMGYDERYS